MNTQFQEFLEQWPEPIFRDSDLRHLFSNDNKRHSAIKRALAKKKIQRVKRGLYVHGIAHSLDAYQLAPLIYGPSFISFESALSIHQWIPEQITCIMSASAIKKKEFDTPFGSYHYHKIPRTHFLLEVEIKNKIFLATPWRAIADIIYRRKKHWKSIHEFSDDLRIEVDFLEDLHLNSLEILCKDYPVNFVRKNLLVLMKELSR